MQWYELPEICSIYQDHVLLKSVHWAVKDIFKEKKTEIMKKIQNYNEKANLLFGIKDILSFSATNNGQVVLLLTVRTEWGFVRSDVEQRMTNFNMHMNTWRVW